MPAAQGAADPVDLQPELLREPGPVPAPDAAIAQVLVEAEHDEARARQNQIVHAVLLKTGEVSRRPQYLMERLWIGVVPSECLIRIEREGAARREIGRLLALPHEVAGVRARHEPSRRGQAGSSVESGETYVQRHASRG